MLIIYVTHTSVVYFLIFRIIVKCFHSYLFDVFASYYSFTVLLFYLYSTKSIFGFRAIKEHYVEANWKIII